jgi:signal transduction histidine kinase
VIGDTSLESITPSEPVDPPRAAAPRAPERDQQRLAAILEFMPGFSYTIDRQLVFTWSDGKGLGLLNLRPGQIVGLNVRDMWGPHDETYEPLVCHLAALAGKSATYRDVCLGRSLEYQVRPLRDGTGAVIGAIGVGIDVTDGARARQEQAKLAAQLRHAQKLEAIGRLAGGVAHDFNNFLTCIMGNLAGLERHVAKGSTAAECLSDANAAVDSAASLTRQLLTFSRKQVINPRPINLTSLIERLDKILDVWSEIGSASAWRAIRLCGA